MPAPGASERKRLGAHSVLLVARVERIVAGRAASAHRPGGDHLFEFCFYFYFYFSATLPLNPNGSRVRTEPNGTIYLSRRCKRCKRPGLTLLSDRSYLIYRCRPSGETNEASNRFLFTMLLALGVVVAVMWSVVYFYFPHAHNDNGVLFAASQAPELPKLSRESQVSLQASAQQ